MAHIAAIAFHPNNQTLPKKSMKKFTTLLLTATIAVAGMNAQDLNLHITGDATGSWNNNPGDDMKLQWNAEKSVYSWTGDLQKDKNFRFLTQNNWYPTYTTTESAHKTVNAGTYPIQYDETARSGEPAFRMEVSGNFTIKTVQAKVAQNGSWTDITEDMYVEISENTTVYVLVTDQRGKTYEKNRYIKCFDFTKPTLNAAVSDGLLSVQAHDTDSGIKAVYVNGYEFAELTNGVLNIRLQQFDAGYQYFTISAMDNAGNMSEVYKTANPYYTDPEKEDSSEKNPAEQLPVNAQATKPSSATAQVTEHTKTDSDGNTVSELSPAEQKKQAMAEAAASEKKEGSGEKEKSETGKEFYTIQTASEKVFYLIIDRDGEEEMVYFLTEVTENDLLNVTADNSETLPKNSAALESAIPVSEGALPNNNGEQETEEELTEEPDGEENTEEPEPEPEKAEENPMATYIILGVVAVIAIGGGYYFKVVRKKKEEFLDEDDDEEDEEEEYDDEEEEKDSEDDFFDDNGEE